MKCDRDVSEKISEVAGGICRIYRTLACAGAAIQHCDADSDERVHAGHVVLDQIEELAEVCGKLDKLNMDLALETARVLGKESREAFHAHPAAPGAKVVELKPRS